MRTCATLILLISLSACASHTRLNEGSSKIRPGMTSAELQEAMGPPQNRQFRESQEAWQWCSTGLMESDSYVLAWLTKGVVTGMQTYRNSRTGPCDSFFRTANWQEAPDATIELRHR